MLGVYMERLFGEWLIVGVEGGAFLRLTIYDSLFTIYELKEFIMKKIIMTLIILLFGAGLIWYFFFNQKSEEDVVKAQLTTLLKLCLKNGSESAIVIAMKNSELSNMFAPTCSVSIKEMIMNGSYTPMELSASIIKSRLLFTTIKGKISDMEVTINSENISAVIDYSVHVVAQRKQGQAYNDSRELRSELEKIDGVWKFASFEIREILEK